MAVREQTCERIMEVVAAQFGACSNVTAEAITDAFEPEVERLREMNENLAELCRSHEGEVEQLRRERDGARMALDVAMADNRELRYMLERLRATATEYLAASEPLDQSASSREELDAQNARYYAARDAMRAALNA